MARVPRTSEVLTVRVPRALGQRLAREARKRRRSRSQLARELLETALEGHNDQEQARLAEARRQSLLVRDHESEREALEWIMDAADLEGWE